MAVLESYIVNSVSTPLLVPGLETKTGTFSSSATTLTGVGTKWTNPLELRIGDYVQSGNEIRRVVDIKSDTVAVIDAAFTTPIGGGTDFARVKRKRYQSITVIASAGTPSINGVAMAAGSSQTIADEIGFLPLIIVATGANVAEVRAITK